MGLSSNGLSDATSGCACFERFVHCCQKSSAYASQPTAQPRAVLLQERCSVVYAYCQLQSAKPKRKWTRRKDPAEVSASCRAAVNKLVEYEGEMIPACAKGGRITGEQTRCAAPNGLDATAPAC
jgi:hypothetical protein